MLVLVSFLSLEGLLLGLNNGTETAWATTASSTSAPVIGILGPDEYGTIDNPLLSTISGLVNKLTVKQFLNMSSMIATPLAIRSSSHQTNIYETSRRSSFDISFWERCGFPDKLQPIGQKLWILSAIGNSNFCSISWRNAAVPGSGQVFFIKG